MCLRIDPLSIRLTHDGGFQEALPKILGFVPPSGCIDLHKGFKHLLSRDAHVVAMTEVKGVSLKV